MKIPNPSPQPHKGFALVVTVSMMVILTAVAVGLLTLSAVSLKSSSLESSQARARANARMALMIAIGELQKHTGPDTRITAPANIVDPQAPHIVGAWKSWEGNNHDNTGRPTRPNYDSKLQPSTSPDGRFITWLISGAIEGQNITNPSALASETAAIDGSTIALLGAGTLGSNPGQIHVVPQPVQDGQNTSNGGTYAWWISAENQKARLGQPYEPKADNAAGWSELAKTHSTADPESFGLESLLDDPESYAPDPSDIKPGRKAMSRLTLKLLQNNNTVQPQQKFHDLTTTSVGLLTNTATGGWRKDLSILSEKWNDIYSKFPGAKLPLFRYSPEDGDTSLVPKPTENDYDLPQSNFYPWSGYSQIGADKYPSTYHTACSSWQSLANFTTYYKNITFYAATQTAEAPFGWDTIIRSHNGGPVSNSNFYKYYHGMEINPVVARIQLVVQANAILNPDPKQKDPSLHYRINMKVVPIITLWNPYNVEINKTLKGGTYTPNIDPDFGIGTQRSLPVMLGIMNGTVPPAGGFPYKFLNGGNSDTADGKLAGSGYTHYYDYQIPENITNGYGSGSGYSTQSQYIGIRAVTAWLPIEFSLKPGEVKVYTPTDNRDGAWSGGVRLKEGFETGDDYGLMIAVPNEIDPDDQNTYKYLHKVQGRPGNQLHFGDLVKFSLKTDRYTKIYSNAITDKPGAGAYFSIGTSHWPVNLAELVDGKVPKGANYIRSNMITNPDMEWAQKYWPSDELDEVQYNVSELVAGGGNPPWTNIFSISFGPRLTIGAGYGNKHNRPTKGLLQSSPFVANTYSTPEQESQFHPANGAYDISYSSMSVNSDLSPEVGTSGYIVSGFQSGEGLSRIIMSEVPLTPMASLAELQNWNLRGHNPAPPYQYNLIGNSDATPLIKQNDILPTTPMLSDVSKNLQHDDAYCANHLLFDDWFFSSIAPQPKTFGRSIEKDIKTVYQDYLEGKNQLTNRAYQPIGEDRELEPAAASKRVKEVLESSDADGWLKVASRFEVHGMFNINSTSAKAWRALLGHARKQQITYHGTDGIKLDATKHDYAVSRHTVASDVKAGNEPGLGASFPSGSEYSGFRTLSNDQLDNLADKIVEQVQKRGPFLSLSEFVNRQLSSDDELSMAGTLQTALDHLTDDPNMSLKSPSLQLSSEAMDPSDNKLDGVGYAFGNASQGMSTHGLPGWIRQADILRPIAPVLSARDDTFTIRAYGDARNANGDVIARAWCEATVRRTRNFIDPEDPADAVEPPTRTMNQNFGREYILTSFRWLNANEV